MPLEKVFGGLVAAIKESVGPELMRTIGVDNQGYAMIALYAMLVSPREIVQQAYATEYDAINTWFAAHTQNTPAN